MDDEKKVRILTMIIGIASMVIGVGFLYYGTAVVESGKSTEALFVALGVVLIMNGVKMVFNRS